MAGAWVLVAPGLCRRLSIDRPAHPTNAYHPPRFVAREGLREKVLAELDLEHRPKVKRKALLISPALLSLSK